MQGKARFRMVLVTKSGRLRVPAAKEIVDERIACQNS